MGKGSVWATTTNFRRYPSKFNIVEKMRRYIDAHLYDRPAWLESAERAPPPELASLFRNRRVVHNPYPDLVRTILHKYPHLRFQDCYVDGNDWSPGNDRYRDDHPVMQLAARQLQLMNEGYPKRQALAKAEEEFRGRRRQLERSQKIMMALAVDERVDPIFTTGHAYWQSQIADEEARHLLRIRRILRILRRRAVAASCGTGPDAQGVGVIPPRLTPRNYMSRNRLRALAMRAEDAPDTAPPHMEELGEKTGEEETQWLEETQQKEELRYVDGHTVSVPYQAAHMKKKSAAYDPLYAARHGLFLSEPKSENDTVTTVDIVQQDTMTPATLQEDLSDGGLEVPKDVDRNSGSGSSSPSSEFF